MLEGGHAANALPQAARATINCRVVPGQCTAELRAALVRALADDQISVSHALERTEAAPTVRNDELWSAIEKTAAEFWPGTPVFSVMMPGANDGRILRGAGIPTYGHTGLASGESRAHGKDERVPVKSFFDSAEYLYRLVKRLSGGA
jgi:acetylornithine deacetylase/succinyl-diaminopimelate desuccinylase-like protein